MLYFFQIRKQKFRPEQCIRHLKPDISEGEGMGKKERQRKEKEYKESKKESERELKIIEVKKTKNSSNVLFILNMVIYSGYIH